MGRHGCSVKQKLRKGLWSPEEDEKLIKYISRFGVGCWSSVPKHAGLQRCGKSCRLRWINYLRPDLKRGMFSQQEESIILDLHQLLGNRWAQIASQLPGRTDNEIKNFWNSCLKKKLMKQGIDPNTHRPITCNAYATDKKIESLASCSSSMPFGVDFERAFYIHNNEQILPSSSVYSSNLVARYHQANYETPLPNLASTNHEDTDFSDHSGLKMTANSSMINEGRESSSGTNSSSMNTNLCTGFMTFEEEMFQINEVDVKCELQGSLGQWQDHMHDVQVNSASDFNIYSMG